MSRRSSSSSRRRRQSKRASLPSPRLLILPAFVAAAVVLGGASAAGALPNLLLQLGGIGCVWAGFVASGNRPSQPGERVLVGIGLAFVAVACLQLVPLPPALWSALPGRASVAQQFHLLGAPLLYLPLSLNPAATVSSLLALCVAAGMYALVRRAAPPALNAFAWSVVAIAAVSVLVGFLQLVSGQHSPLYLYTNTNRDQPVGFFANSNHLATLELMALPLVAGLAARRGGRDDDGGGWAGNLVILGAGAVLILLGLVTNGSVAGLGLLLPVAIGCFLLFRGRRSRRMALIAFGIAGLLTAIFVLLALNSPLISGFANTSLDAGPTSRLGFLHTTLAAIATYLPAGSGLGTFTSVFPSFEDPATVSSVFVNHAHDDYIEFVLDMGVPGIVLIAAFLGWWVWRTIAIWRDRDSGALARAATISTAAVLGHSLVDYPIRTAAITAVFVGCCAIMARSTRAAPPPPPVTEDMPVARHLSA